MQESSRKKAMCVEMPLCGGWSVGLRVVGLCVCW